MKLFVCDYCRAKIEVEYIGYAALQLEAQSRKVQLHFCTPCWERIGDDMRLTFLRGMAEKPELKHPPVQPIKAVPK